MKALRMLWAWLREVSGDDAYERYLAHQASAHPGQTPLDRRAFFRRLQADAWTGVRRCC
ncbi:MAG: YbdD/YjiX family protein [Immundisolibacter sp.]|uniref:YbdD/YjiX family protein n=1 Tax=Immundisolibacter sp. TaxID=1934948 RepID=UPI003EE32E66